MPPITFTTDFGLADPYVASMKGVVLSLNPQAVIVDVSHDVRPQQVEHGAFLLEAAVPCFPRGTIHVAVVDPGVGTERQAVAIQTADALYVGPDNGLLSPALPNDARSGAADAAARLPLPPNTSAVSLTNPHYHRRPVSDTFHGRDIFAPVAAHLSLGAPLYDLGQPVDDVLTLPPFRARRLPDGSIRGRVVHVDAFGNLITDVRADDLPDRQLDFQIAGRVVAGLRKTYAGATDLTALVGSYGFLEIALPQGSAAAALAVDIGEPVLVRAP